MHPRPDCFEHRNLENEPESQQTNRAIGKEWESHAASDYLLSRGQFDRLFWAPQAGVITHGSLAVVCAKTS